MDWSMVRVALMLVGVLCIVAQGGMAMPFHARAYQRAPDPPSVIAARRGGFALSVRAYPLHPKAKRVLSALISDVAKWHSQSFPGVWSTEEEAALHSQQFWDMVETEGMTEQGRADFLQDRIKRDDERARHKRYVRGSMTVLFLAHNT